jgi:protein phosphatase
MELSWSHVVVGLAFAVVVYLVYRRAPAPAPSEKRSRDSGRRSRESDTRKLKTVPAEDKAAAPADKAEKTENAETPASKAPANAADVLIPRLAFEDDDDDQLTKLGVQGRRSIPPAKIVYDEDAASDEPTRTQPLILISATAQTDTGLRRKRNEDSVLVREVDGLFVVADGMGGHRGGALASELCVKTIERAFATQTFHGTPHDAIPKRASQLARAIQMANEAILDRANQDRLLEGMGTTVCAAMFSLTKQRLYIGHVGDSRIYCLRDGVLRQMTNDHTMKEFGVDGDAAAHLSRAVGIRGEVPVDIILGKPKAGDVYLLCSDGLTKMVDDDDIRQVLQENAPQEAVEKLIAAANARGGMDNVTTVVVKVEAPYALRSSSQAL